MEMTMFLAQLWGPALLAVGLGVFLTRDHYVRIYRDLQREPLALLMFGMSGIVVGILHINAHNVWANFPQIVVSLLGWGLFVKAVLFTIAPKFVDQVGDRYAMGGAQMVNVAAGFMLVMGAYLSWIAYFS